jgi:heptosyltransferase-1
MKRIAIIKLWALGDILMATPLLSALRTAHPGIEITWVVDQAHGGILEGHPGIDRLIVLDTGAWRRQWRKLHYGAWWHQRQRFRASIETDGPLDAAINCHAEKWWTALLGPAPVRVGLYPGARPNATARLYTHAVARPPQTHSTEHYLLAARALGIVAADRAMTLGELPHEAAFVDAFLARHGLRRDRPRIVVAPFSTRANKDWPTERGVELVESLVREQHAQVIVTFAPRDAATARALFSGGAPHVVLAEGTSLPEYVALIRDAHLVICMDSSAMHMAAAVGTPYVALFGPTPAALLAPLVGRGKTLLHPVPCAPCDRPTCANPEFRACMNRITVAEVQTAAAAFLEIPR